MPTKNKGKPESVLESLKPGFHGAFPRLASGQYVHFLMLRHSQSFPIFQTDGSLNTARTQAGLDAKDEKSRQRINRLVMFKRKQVTPERLAGRQLLRSLGFIDGVEGTANFCEYNGGQSCEKCPDCILYGFAIGAGGDERSKVYSDSAFSLSTYEASHKTMTFNALAETGTMSERVRDQVIVRSSINEQEHILPEVVFPSVESLRDSTFEGFIYVLGNLLRTRRYGAQESRTGVMTNYIIGIVFGDGEIFSNLHFTQALYDTLQGDLSLPIDNLRDIAANVVQAQLDQEPILIRNVIFGEMLEALLSEVIQIYQDATRAQDVLATLYEQTQTYAGTYGAITPRKNSR
ncbi:MAG TPA: type I-D CRISPR-associated protein Cas7/Csc2 [Trichocoleus sp.]|jgi:CRISPR-associated protein Csc2